MASAVTLNLFLAIFPLLLIAISIVGFITNNNADTIDDLISTLGLTSQAADTLNQALHHAADTKEAASIIGLVGLLWSGLAVVGAMENALDVTWQQTGRGFKDKLRGLAWCVGASIISGLAIAFAAWANILNGWLLSTFNVLTGIIINGLFALMTFLILTFKRVEWKAYLPGTIFAAFGIEAIKQASVNLPQLFDGSSALYGSIGLVFGLIAIFALFGRVFVYASVINVVFWERKHGSTSVDVEAPSIPGESPKEANRSGAVAQ